MRVFVSSSLCVVLNLLYASFSMCAPIALGHIDPLVFTALQLALLVPLAVVAAWHWRAALTRDVLLISASIGGCLSAGFVLITVALTRVGITESTILSCINGVLAALVGWRLFHQRLALLTRVACGCALVGALCIGISTPWRWQGDITAFVGGGLVTVSTFLWERALRQWPLSSGQSRQRQRSISLLWSILACQFLVMAALALLAALCFGDWHSLTRWAAPDTLAVLYCGVMTVLVPTILSAWMQFRQLASAVSIAFFALLDPLSSAAFAFVVMGERLPLLSYIGAACVLTSMLCQAFAPVTPATPLPAGQVQARSVERRAMGPATVP